MLYGPNNNLSEADIDRLVYAIRDLSISSSAMTFMLEEIDFDEKYKKSELRKFQCYDTTAIISFRRAFDKNIRNCYKKIGISLTSEEEEIINEMSFLRDKIIAHSDSDQMHFRVKFARGNDLPIPFPMIDFDEGLRLERIKIYKYKSLISKIIKSILALIIYLEKNSTDVIEKYQKPKDH